MKRRRFVRGLLTVPALSAAVEAAQTPQPAASPQQQPVPSPVTPARQEPRPVPVAPRLLQLVACDLTADPAPHFFTARQFSTLQKLAELFMPPLKNNPGAMEAGAPEFLDFLISESPAARQQSYQFGLDHLELQAKDRYQKSFASLDEAESAAILKPLLVVRFWPEDLPGDPLQSFVAQVHEDLRTATQNSREWAEASEKSGRRFTRGFRGSGYYWNPIDPIVS